MKKVTLGILLVVASLPALSYADMFGSSMCGGAFSCGQQIVKESSDVRTPPGPVVQPSVDASVMGSCGVALPTSQSYQARPAGVACGSGGDNRPRKPAPIPDDIMDKWSIRSRSGKGTVALEEMQEIRHMDEKLTGSIDYSVVESWSYQEKVGGFNSSRCGTEMVAMTCYQERTETYTTQDWVEGDCDRWEDPPPPPPPVTNNAGNSFVPSYDNSPAPARRQQNTTSTTIIPASPYRNSNTSPAPKTYQGESRKDIGNYMRAIPTTKPSGAPKRRSSIDLEEILQNHNAIKAEPKELACDATPHREIAQYRQCIHHQQVLKTFSHTRAATPYIYACTVPRAKYCEWLETRQASRACPTQTIHYTVEYLHDPNWKPGYKSADNDPARDYSPMIPNKFDLLPGETESRQVYINGISGNSGSILRPSMNITSHWNAYTVATSPDVRCEFGNKTAEAHFQVSTVGRIKQKAPRLLEMPGDDQQALKFDKGRPSEMHLVDGARDMMLDASTLSRSFPGQENIDPKYFKTHADEERASAARGWWVDTRFRLQLFRKDNWSREVSVTEPNTPDSNQVNYYMSAITIGLEGQGAMERFYRPSGPVEFIFGSIYKKFGVELTPGQQYYLRVQVINRGLSFYESGCRGGKRVCEGENAADSSYSEPLDIPFVADPNIDNRSWFKKLKDLQERLKPF